jgi:hypothetical protein
MDQIKLFFGNNQTCPIVSISLQDDLEDNSLNKKVARIVSIDQKTTEVTIFNNVSTS